MACHLDIVLTVGGMNEKDGVVGVVEGVLVGLYEAVRALAPEQPPVVQKHEPFLVPRLPIHKTTSPSREGLSKQATLLPTGALPMANICQTQDTPLSFCSVQYYCTTLH